MLDILHTVSNSILPKTLCGIIILIAHILQKKLRGSQSNSAGNIQASNSPEAVWSLHQELYSKA
jgi:hypothetical protein